MLGVVGAVFLSEESAKPSWLICVSLMLLSFIFFGSKALTPLLVIVPLVDYQLAMLFLVSTLAVAALVHENKRHRVRLKHTVGLIFALLSAAAFALVVGVWFEQQWQSLESWLHALISCGISAALLGLSFFTSPSGFRGRNVWWVGLAIAPLFWATTSEQFLSLLTPMALVGAAMALHVGSRSTVTIGLTTALLGVMALPTPQFAISAVFVVVGILLLLLPTAPTRGVIKLGTPLIWQLAIALVVGVWGISAIYEATPPQQAADFLASIGYLLFLILIALVSRFASRSSINQGQRQIESVLLVIGQLGRGGAEKQLILLANSLAKVGVDTTLVSFHGGERREQVDPLVRLVILQEHPPERIPWVLTVTPKLWATIWYYQPQVVIAFLLYAYLTAIPVAAFSTNAIRVSARRSMGYFKDIFWILTLERLVNAVTNLVVANSKAVAKFSIEQEKLDARRVVVIRNTMTEEWFIDPTNPIEPTTVLNVANLIAYKGQETLLGAFARVQAEHPQARLRIIGDGPERASIEALAQSLRVNLEITGAQAVSPTSYGGVSLFVLSSKEEGMSNSLMEAMAAGLTIVATDVGGNSETLGDAGLLVKPDDEVELAAAMLSLINDKQKAVTLGIEARERAQSLFTGRNLATEYLEVIQKI